MAGLLQFRSEDRKDEEDFFRVSDWAEGCDQSNYKLSLKKNSGFNQNIYWKSYEKSTQ